MVDSNRIARRVFGTAPLDKYHLSAIAGESDSHHLHGETTTAVIDESHRVYAIHVSLLTSETGDGLPEFEREVF